MTRADELVEQGAHRIEHLAEKAAERGPLGEKAAERLTEEAEFLRKLQPSKIAARARGEAPPSDGAAATPRSARRAASGKPAARPKAKPGGGGPGAASVSPVLVIAAAFALGFAVAKFLDWSGHGHPRR